MGWQTSPYCHEMGLSKASRVNRSLIVKDLSIRNSDPGVKMISQMMTERKREISKDSSHIERMSQGLLRNRLKNKCP